MPVLPVLPVLVLVAVLACCVLVVHRRTESFQTPSPTPSSTPRAAAPAIVGGVPAAMSRYPWFCSFFRKRGDAIPFCGGVLIAPDTILTAAHCGIKPGDFVLIGGTTEVFGDPRAVKAAEAIPEFDVAFVKLWTPSKKQPIKLATRLPPDDTMLTILGRGRKGAQQTQPDATFTKAQLQYKSKAALTRLIQAENPSARAELVSVLKLHFVIGAVSDKKSACHGDSGGPLIWERGPGQDELVGIASRGAGPACDDNDPLKLNYSVFVNVPYVMQKKDRALAIRRVLNDKQKCPFSLRNPESGKCPKPRPWDSGVVNDAIQCTSNPFCAALANELGRIMGVDMRPAKHNPA